MNKHAESTYTFHSDAGHGWLEVSVYELLALQVNDRISRYSYHHDARVYLEEDCDAAIFINAKRAAGEAYAVEERHIEGDSPIRGYKRFPENRHLTEARARRYPSIAA